MDLMYFIFVISSYKFPKVTVMLILMVPWCSISLKRPPLPTARSLVLGHWRSQRLLGARHSPFCGQARPSRWGSFILHFSIFWDFTRPTPVTLSVSGNPVSFFKMKYYLSFPPSGLYNVAMSFIFRPLGCVTTVLGNRPSYSNNHSAS